MRQREVRCGLTAQQQSIQQFRQSSWADAQSFGHQARDAAAMQAATPPQFHTFIALPAQ